MDFRCGLICIMDFRGRRCVALFVFALFLCCKVFVLGVRAPRRDAVLGAAQPLRECLRQWPHVRETPAWRHPVVVLLDCNYSLGQDSLLQQRNRSLAGRIVIASQADFYGVEGEALALAVGHALKERRRKD